MIYARLGDRFFEAKAWIKVTSPSPFSRAETDVLDDGDSFVFLLVLPVLFWIIGWSEGSLGLEPIISLRCLGRGQLWDHQNWLGLGHPRIQTLKLREPCPECEFLTGRLTNPRICNSGKIVICNSGSRFSEVETKRKFNGFILKFIMDKKSVSRLWGWLEWRCWSVRVGEGPRFLQLWVPRLLWSCILLKTDDFEWNSTIGPWFLRL